MITSIIFFAVVSILILYSLDFLFVNCYGDIIGSVLGKVLRGLIDIGGHNWGDLTKVGGVPRTPAIPHLTVRDLTKTSPPSNGLGSKNHIMNHPSSEAGLGNKINKISEIPCKSNEIYDKMNKGPKNRTSLSDDLDDIITKSGNIACKLRE